MHQLEHTPLQAMVDDCHLNIGNNMEMRYTVFLHFFAENIKYLSVEVGHMHIWSDHVLITKILLLAARTMRRTYLHILSARIWLTIKAI